MGGGGVDDGAVVYLFHRICFVVYMRFSRTSEPRRNEVYTNTMCACKAGKSLDSVCWLYNILRKFEGN